MSIQRLLTPSGEVRYKARIKSHGRQVSARTFKRRRDAVAWEQEQVRRLRLGEWIDPKRGRVPLSDVAEDWLRTRETVKRRTREADRADWRLHIKPRFGKLPVASITSAEIAKWAGDLVAGGASASSTTRYLGTMRSILNYAIADGRIRNNAAAGVRAPRGGRKRREGRFLTVRQLNALAAACNKPYGELVIVLGLAGLRWGELAGLQVGDLVQVPGRGLRLQRAVLASGEGGGLFTDTLKGHRARTVPLVKAVVPIVDRWAEGKALDDWLFPAPEGGPLGEKNWTRAVDWTTAKKNTGLVGVRIHDLRHTAASVWLGAGADPKVVQRILGHASAAMTMDLYGHLIDHNLWAAAKRVDDAGEDPGDHTGTKQGSDDQSTENGDEETGS